MRASDAPADLRRSLIRRAADERFNVWVAANGWKAKVVADSAHVVSRFLHAEGIRLADLTPGNFEAWFGDHVRACADVVRARESIERFIDNAIVAKGFHPLAEGQIRRIASGIPRVGLASARIVRAVQDAAAEVLAQVLPKVAPARRVTYADTVDRLFGRHRELLTGTERRRMHGTWRCARCRKYAGTGQGVWDHSWNSHGIRLVRDVDAVLEPEDIVIDASLTAEAFLDLVARASRRHGATRTIQACWRTAIACPEFNVCRRRLLREASEMP